MRSHPVVGLFLFLGACGGGGTLYTSLAATPAAGPEEVTNCALAKLRSLNYQVTSYDQTDFRVTAHKADNEAHRADPQFKRNDDRLEIQAAPGADGKTSLTVLARTFAMLETHRGPTDEEEHASEAVKESAKAIVEACGHP